MNVEELDFDEVITIDYNDLPEDETEGAQFRDITLSEMLYEFEDDDYDISSLQKQGL